MSRRHFWLGLAIMALAAIVVRYVYKTRRAAVNNAAIQAALLKYSNLLRPGATRKEVKAYLRTHGVGVFERCCYELRGPFSVLVQVGDEDSPWYCEAWPDFVAFEFSTTEANASFSTPSDSDVLKKVHLTSNGEGCL